MKLSKCCDAEIKFGMVDDRVGHGMHEETECTNCGQLFPEVYDDEEDATIKNQNMTSVDFILEIVQNSKWEYTPWPEREKYIDQARAMHREEVKEAWEMGRFNIDDTGTGNEYYNDTFKN